MTETTYETLDRPSIEEVDVSDLMTDVLAIPEHLRDAQWKAESADLRAWDSEGGLVVAGMGDSAIGGALARAVLGDQASRPIFSSRAYGLPAWTTPDTTVLCASYSGETEETLAAYEAAGALGAKRVVVTSGGELAEQARADGVPVLPVAGGYQHRAAIAYTTVATLHVAAMCGAAPRMASEIDVAAEHLEELVSEWGPDGAQDSEAKALARSLHGAVPVVVGAGMTTPIAYRWKTQINQNTEIPAFSQELPEADHNELVGWTSAAAYGRFAAVFLDADTHRGSRSASRSPASSSPARPPAPHRHSRGQMPIERLFSLELLGDLTSLYMAVLRGVDPSPTTLATELQDRLD